MVDEARRGPPKDLDRSRRPTACAPSAARAAPSRQGDVSGVLDGVSESILSAVETVRMRVEGAEEQARQAAISASMAPPAGDDDLRIDEPPVIPEPTVSASPRQHWREPTRHSPRYRRAGRPSRHDRGRGDTTSPGEDQGIDELFARIRESRQLEVAETRAQIEAVEAELVSPSSEAAGSTPVRARSAATSFYDAEADNAPVDGTLFSASDAPATLETPVVEFADVPVGEARDAARVPDDVDETVEGEGPDDVEREATPLELHDQSRSRER